MEEQSYGVASRYWLSPLQFGRNGKPIRDELNPPPGSGPIVATFVGREQDLWAAYEAAERRAVDAERRAASNEVEIELRFRTKVYEENANFRRFVQHRYGPIYWDEEICFDRTVDGFRATAAFEIECLRFETSYTPHELERVVRSPTRSGVQLKPYVLEDGLTPEQFVIRLDALRELARLDTFQTGLFEREDFEKLYDIVASRAPLSENTAINALGLNKLPCDQATAAAARKNELNGGKTLARLYQALYPMALASDQTSSNAVAEQPSELSEQAPPEPVEESSEPQPLEKAIGADAAADLEVRELDNAVL